MSIYTYGEMDEANYIKPAKYSCGCKVLSIKYSNKHKCLLSRCAADLKIMADMLLIDGHDELHFNVQSTFNQVKGMMSKINE
jgi:hypothetical protein